MTTQITVNVYQANGSTLITSVPRRKGVTWLDELNGFGNGQVSIHADDAILATYPSLLAHGNIVKFAYQGSERFGFRIEKRDTVVVSQQENAGRWITASGRGLTSLLGDADTYPEYGLTRTSGDERAFTFASKTGSWYVSSEWVAPLGSKQGSDPTARAKNPADWPDPNAYWIWPTDPTVTVPDNTTAFFRASLTLSASTSLRFYASGDNYVAVYVDGELVLESDFIDPFAWRTTYTYSVTLASGTHQIAIRGRNSSPTAPGAQNPAGVLLTVAQVNADGTLGSFLLRTDTTHWLCHTDSPVPGFRGAHILQTLLDEAKTRGVTALSSVTTDFTATADSTAVAWTDRQDLAVRIAFESLWDVAAKLAESSIDVAISPGMVLQAWKFRGTDRSTGASPVTLAKGVSLVDHKVTSTAPTATRLLVRDGLGWVEVVDTAAESAIGRREQGLQLGGAQSDATATSIAQATFAQTSTAQQTISSGQMPARTGATPYVDFFLGDYVLTPGETGANVKVRVAALTVTEDDNGNVFFVPEMYA